MGELGEQPAQWGRQEGHHNILVQQAGGGTIIIGRGEARLTLDRRHARKPRMGAGPDAWESFLLRPQSRTVELVGRQPELASFWAWLRKPANVSLRCLIGRAGSGKTRLALELCEQAESEAWQAGFAAHKAITRFVDARDLAAWDWERPTLVVADYAAESAPALRQWLVELTRSECREPLRLLLLERDAEPDKGWWHTLIHSERSSEADIEALPEPPERLPMLADIVERRRLLEGVMRAAAAHLGRAAPALPPLGADPMLDAALGETRHEREPLFLMMAGIEAVRAGSMAALSLPRTTLAERFAGRELDRVEALGGEDKSFRRTLRHLAAVATLQGGVAAPDVRAAVEQELQALGSQHLLDAMLVSASLQDALPADAGGVAPIQPDLIGERATIAALLVGGDAQAVRRAHRRAAAATSASVCRTIEDFVHLHPQLLDWFEATLAESDTVEEMMALSNALPRASFALAERSVAISQALTGAFRSRFQSGDAEAQPLLAMALNNLGNGLSNLGRREAALEASREAVAITRQLAADRPDAFLPELASALNNVSVYLSNLGRREAALEASREAVAIYRQLAADRPDAFQPDLATALNNVSGDLFNLGRRKAALEALREAVAIYRQLAADRPDAFLPDLARALNNLGMMLANLGRRAAALEASSEAVAIYRQLVADRPDAFLPELATALNNQGNRHSELGRRQEALAASREAVAFFRKLAADQPDAFLPDLAGALSNQGNRLSNLGRREEALEASRDAVAMRRKLAVDRPDAFLPDLAKSLGAYGQVLADLGRHAEAAGSFREGVSLISPLFDRRPGAFEGLLHALAGDYLRACDEAGTTPDREIMAMVGALDTSLQPSTPAPEEPC